MDPIRLERLPADLSPPGVAAVHDVVRHQEEGLQELHCPAQDVGQPVQYTIVIIPFRKIKEVLGNRGFTKWFDATAESLLANEASKFQKSANMDFIA